MLKDKIRRAMENGGYINKETNKLEIDPFELDVIIKNIVTEVRGCIPERIKIPECGGTTVNTKSANLGRIWGKNEIIDLIHKGMGEQ